MLSILINILLAIWLIPAVAIFAYNWLFLIIEAHGDDMSRANARARIPLLQKAFIWPVLVFG